MGYWSVILKIILWAPYAIRHVVVRGQKVWRTQTHPAYSTVFAPQEGAVSPAQRAYVSVNQKQTGLIM